jgi:hypothetical protein
MITAWEKMQTKEYFHEYTIKHRKEIKRYQKEYYLRNKHKKNIQSHTNYTKIKETKLAEAKKYRWEIKKEVLSHYSNGTCVCIRCGFDDIRALSIDHINGGGNKARKENICMSGVHFYRWLKNNNYPLGYQTLCMNCQKIKQFENNEWSKGSKSKYNVKEAEDV